MTSLSGGEAARAALAAVLLVRFDVFLLDEPTNNLDFAGLARLDIPRQPRGRCRPRRDRAFLDRTINRVVEIEAETRRVHEYRGTWSDYEAARERARERHEAAYADYVDEKERYSALLADRRRQAHALGGERKLARQTGGSDRLATNALRGKVNQAKNHLERVEEVEKPWTPWRLQLDLPTVAAGGGLVAELAGAVVERGAQARPLSLELHWGDRLAVVGANGSGKSTLIAALLGDLPLAAGTRRLGPSVVFGELNQARDQFSGRPPRRLRRGLGLLEAEARTLLAKFSLGRRTSSAPPAPLAGRAHPCPARRVDGPRRQLARARRADEPPRPGGDRGAGDGARDLRRLSRRRHARPQVPRTAVGEPYARAVRIDELRAEDWPACARIYEAGLDVGTFEETVPSWEDWDASHLGSPRLVARDDDAILGWAALAPVSRRECYRGVTENSVYVAPAARGRASGRRSSASSSGAPTPRASGRSRPGFCRQRRLGRAARALRLPGRRHRERIAQKRGEWRDVVLMERRAP
jgi:L-amino acid N-acyltransferase YncA/ABC-type uncharacterized transport system YnjBCD ATPase subunit